MWYRLCVISTIQTRYRVFKPRTDWRMRRMRPRTSGNTPKMMSTNYWQSAGRYLSTMIPLRHRYSTSCRSMASPTLELKFLFGGNDRKISLEPRGGLRRLVRNKRLADEIIYEMAEKRGKKFESSKARHGGRNGSGRNVRFDDHLSEYSFGRRRHRGHSGRGDSRTGSSRSRQSRRDTSPTRTYSSHSRRSARTKVELSLENKRLKKMVRQLERDRGSVTPSDSETDSDYWLRWEKAVSFLLSS